MTLEQQGQASDEAAALAFTVDKAAKQTSISRSALYIMMKTGELRYSRFGKRRLILASDLHSVITKHRENPEGCAA